MRSVRKPLTFVATVLVSLTGYVLYTSWLGGLTDFPQLEAELRVPMAGIGELPVSLGLPEYEVAAIRGFGEDAPELDRNLKLRPVQPKKAVAGRGFGVHIYTEEYEIVKESRNRIRLRPFSLVSIGPSGDGDRQQDQIYTLRADEAILTLDQEVSITDPGQINGAQPLAAKVIGNVELKDRRRTPAGSDDIRLYCHEMTYDEPGQTVVAPGRVKINVGLDTVVEGLGMTVDLIPEDERAKMVAEGGKDEDVRRMTLREDVRFDLFLADGALDGQPVDATPDPAAPPEQQDRTPVTVESAGPFVFEALTDTATFREHVQVLRTVRGRVEDGADAGGKDRYDQLLCDDLVLRFEPPAAGADAGPATGPTGALKLRSMTATGTNLIVNFESENIVATGDHLFHDVVTRRMVLSDAREMFADHGAFRIHGLRLTIDQGPDKRIRQLVADGPNGWMEIRDREAVIDAGGDARPPAAGDGQPLTIHWADRLTMQPEPGTDHQIVVIREDVEVDDSQLALSCDELTIHLAPAAEEADADDSGQTKLEPVLMEATSAGPDGVIATTEEMHVQTGKLTVVIRKTDAPADPPAEPAVVETTAGADAPPAAPVAAARPNAEAPAEESEAEEPAAPLDVRAAQVALVVRRERGKSTPEKAWAEGAVIVTQPPARPGGTPLLIEGHSLEFERRDAGDLMDIVGSPERIALLQTPDLVLTGRKRVNLDEARNVVRAEGVGYLIREGTNDLNGNADERPQRLRIDWNERMVFDGREAAFDGAVRALQAPLDDDRPTAQIECLNMIVTFDRTIRFRESRTGGAAVDSSGQKAQIKTVDCDQQVGVTEIVHEGEQVVRRSTLVADELHIDNLRNQAVASVLGTNVGDLQISEINRAPGKPPYTQTRIRFHGLMDARKDPKVAYFYDNVLILHADTADPVTTLTEANLPADGISIRAADSANMNEQSVGDRSFRNFVAKGDVVVKSEDGGYTATCDKLTYDQAKDMLSFYGEQGRKARFFRQTRPGEPAEQSSGDLMRYSRTRKKLSVDGSDGFSSHDLKPGQ